MSLLDEFTLNRTGELADEVLEYLCEFVPPDVLLQILGLNRGGDTPEEALAELLGHQPWYSAAEDTPVQMSPAMSTASS